MLGEVSLLTDDTDATAAADAAGAAGAASLAAGQVAICWRGDCKYVATLVQHGRTAPLAADAQASNPTFDAGQKPKPGSAATPAAATQQTREAATTLKIWLRDGCQLHAVGEAAAGLLPVGSSTAALIATMANCLRQIACKEWSVRRSLRTMPGPARGCGSQSGPPSQCTVCHMSCRL